MTWTLHTVLRIFIALSSAFASATLAGSYTNDASPATPPQHLKPAGNGLFILYYGGWLDKKTKQPDPGTLATMTRLWKLQPNFVVVANEFKASPEIVNIFHKTEDGFHAVKVLLYVMMTDEPCRKLRSAKEIDKNTAIAMATGYDGMFFDCARQDSNTYPNIHGWNADRVREAKKSGNKLIIMNPGEALVESRMFDYADIVSVENQYDVSPSAFVRSKEIEPGKSEKMEIAPWRWLAVQGHPSNQAAHSAEEAVDRLKAFRQKGGFWYYSPAYKMGDNNTSTHIELPDWLDDFAQKVKLLGDCPCPEAAPPQQPKVKIVPSDGIYHGAFPEFMETEDIVTATAIRDFENAVGKNIAWAYFSNNWFVENDDGKRWPEIRFPREAVLTIWNLRKENRVIPFIRMMPRSKWEEKKPKADPVYQMKDILAGKFDAELREWARSAKAVRTLDDPSTPIPLMVEFGAEVNGGFFPWSGRHNGGSKTNGYGDPAKADGPERYRDAYRHIIDICRAEHAYNITWVFHVHVEADPQETWNNMAAYYPGDDYIDWIGASVYGPTKPTDPFRTFEAQLTAHNAWDELSKLSSKPIAILEFGIDDDPRKPDWIKEALTAIKARSTRIKAISYWNSSQKDEDDGWVTRFRLEGKSLESYRSAVSDPIFLPDVKLGE